MWKDNPQNGRKQEQMKQLPKDKFAKYTSNSYNSMPEKQKTQSKNGKKT